MLLIQIKPMNDNVDAISTTVQKTNQLLKKNRRFKRLGRVAEKQWI